MYRHRGQTPESSGPHPYPARKMSAAAVGSLMIRKTSKPAIVPASCGLPLAVREIGGHRNHGFVHLLLKVCLRICLQLVRPWPTTLAAYTVYHLSDPVIRAHMSLDGNDGAIGIETACRLAT